MGASTSSLFSEEAPTQEVTQTVSQNISGSPNAQLSTDPFPRPRQSSRSQTTIPPQPPNTNRMSYRNRRSVSLMEHAPVDLTSFGDDDEMVVATNAAPSVSQPEPEVQEGGPLSISARVEYASLPKNKAQDIFGLVTVEASSELPQAKTGDRQPLDIICVLDVSGSMGGQKIALVQDAVRFVIRETQAQDRLSIISFNHSGTRHLRLRRMDDVGKDDATSAVLRLTAGGGTEISSGLELAVEVAERRRQRNPVSAILLLTDGQDGSSRHRLPALVDRATAAGCSLYTFGFGSDHDSALLSSIAEQAQTPFTFVEDVDRIGEAFAGAIGGLASVAAQQVQVVLDCSVELKAVHTPFNVERAGARTTVKIPDMLAGEKRNILVELSVPEARDEETKLLEASASYWNLPAAAAAQTSTVVMCASRPAEEAQPEQEPDIEVTSQRQRVEVAQTLQEAAAHGDAGRFDQAQSVLQSCEKRLKSSTRLTPVSEDLMLELTDAQDRMKSRSSWECGGSAEVKDAMNMHRQERCTNMTVSSMSSVMKTSKRRYCTSAQQECISKASSR